MPKDFDLFIDEAPKFTEYLAFFEIPHYTNDFVFDTVERHYQWVPGLDKTNPEQLTLVRWKGEKPTPEEIQAKYDEDYGHLRDEYDFEASE